MEIMLEEWAVEWFRAHVEGRLAPNTEGGYQNLIFNHIVPRLGGTALTDLGEKRIRSFYRKLPRAGLNARSVWCVHLLLRRILDEACREGLILENPAWGISVEHGEALEPNRLRSGQVKRYLGAAQGLSAYPILYVGLASGLRQGELISLPWAAVDVCGRRVVLEKRWVGLSARAAELMMEEYARHPSSPEAFQAIRTIALIPAKAILRRDVYYTYACETCEKSDISTPIVKAPKEPAVIPDSFASPEAIAHIMTQKFVMYAPLYRQTMSKLGTAGSGGSSAAGI